MIRPALAVLASVVLAAGCATFSTEEELQLQEGAEKVRLFQTEQRGCRFIAEITGYYAAREKYEDTEDKARIALKNEAHAKKANAVVIHSIDRRKENPETGFDEPASTKIVGSAYHCWNLDRT